MLCTQTAPQLRTLRSVQFENADKESRLNLQQHLEWINKTTVSRESKDSGFKDNDGKSKTDKTNKVPRPMNSFMVFSHLERKRLAEENPELHNADLSKILGRKWKTLPPAQRQPYIDEAERLRVLHTETFPDYKYKPRRRKHPKRNTKKFSTLSPNDVKLKMKVALNLDCTLPAANYHPLDQNLQSPKADDFTNFSQSQAQLSPETLQNDATDDIPPTPEDSPVGAKDFQDIELKLNQPAPKLQNTQDAFSSMYSFLPPTPELSPQVVTSVNRATFNFDCATSPDLLIKTENLGLLTIASDAKLGFVTNTSVSLPTISSFGSLYPVQETPAVASPSRVRDQQQPAKVELFSDVDRDEFDQYLGAPLEKTQLSNSLRNIIQELEENFKSS